jgi:hypothetical protein
MSAEVSHMLLSGRWVRDCTSKQQTVVLFLGPQTSSLFLTVFQLSIGSVRWGYSSPNNNSLCLQIQAKFKAMCAVMRVAVALDRCDSATVDRVTVLQDLQSCVLVRTPPLLRLLSLEPLVPAFFFEY